jgi:site-specific DNA recombinase
LQKGESVMNVAAYCRVSTDKTDQINSLATQKQFFEEYCLRNNLNLVHTYADEGISGTKTRNRKEFMQMMEDANQKKFEQVVVKDVSRLARNTVDLLQCVRKLRDMNIETVFITANMQSMGNSEFVLTLMGAMAQEESANTSKRVKFGKKENAKKGKVPNLVYGYDKKIGDYFNLSINQKEAKTVRQIYDWYAEEGYGAGKISKLLNKSGILTKRGCRWSQNAVMRILKNEIYTGRIINGKEEVKDFLTGNRIKKEENSWIVTEKPEIRIVSREQYEKAQAILKERLDTFQVNRLHSSGKYPLSTLIKCDECGFSFKRIERNYKNTRVYWVCSGRNSNGTESCSNKVHIVEEEIFREIGSYLRERVLKKEDVRKKILKEINRSCLDRDFDGPKKDELEKDYNRMMQKKEKYTQMFMDDLISREELRMKISEIQKEMEKIWEERKLAFYRTEKKEKVKRLIEKTFENENFFLDFERLTNMQMKKLIEEIRVEREGTVHIYLKCLI